MEKSFGKYQVNKELGRGAMGVVYLGYDTALDRPVAIKTIASTMREEELKKRFIREAQSAGKLRHNNIVTIYDFGLENDQLYLVMEYLEGQDLESLIASKKPLDLRERLDIVRQLCLGLNYAHEHGILHRDIKPANIRILPDGTVKIVDFGLASMQTSTLTKSNAILGTPHFMAPERIQGEKADGRSDQFSTGLILYELLTYQRPFTGDSISSIIFKILNQQPKRLDPQLIDQYPKLENIIKKAIAKIPGNRYPSMKEMIADIETLQQELTRDNFIFTDPIPLVEELMILPAETETFRPATDSCKTTIQKKEPKKKHRTLARIIPALILLIAIYIVFFHRGPITPPPTANAGYLAFDVKPFAHIEEIINQETGEPVSLPKDSRITPVRLILSPGKYRLVYSNPRWSGKNRTLSFSITTGKTSLLKDSVGEDFIRDAIRYFSINPN